MTSPPRFATGSSPALQAYTHPAVLVMDEVGYLTYGTDAANMLFHVVNERHRRHRSMIFTTNKALKAWGHVLHDEDLGEAIIDRVLERGRLIRLDAPSIRTLHLKLDDALKDDSDILSVIDAGTTHHRRVAMNVTVCASRVHGVATVT